jgi:amidase
MKSGPLCWYADGSNEHTGTPLNPLDPARVPLGSSSGSAVVVALGEADIALGTDTGGSVRIPAACCGIAGLKTTRGRVSRDGVFPLSPEMDTEPAVDRAVDEAVAATGWRRAGPARRQVAGHPPRGDGDIPASVQLVGPPHSESLLLGLAAQLPSKTAP